MRHGKVVKLRGFPKDHKVRLFRVEASTRRTDYIVTKDETQESTAATQEVCGSTVGGVSSCTERENS